MFHCFTFDNINAKLKKKKKKKKKKTAWERANLNPWSQSLFAREKYEIGYVTPWKNQQGEITGKSFKSNMDWKT